MKKKNTARAAGMTQISISMSNELLARIEAAAAAENRNITNVMQAHLNAKKGTSDE